MKLQLPSEVISPQDLKAVIVEIREYARWAMHVQTKQRVTAEAMEPTPTISPTTVAVVRSWQGAQPLTSESLDALLAELASFESSAPRATITLAAPPSRDLKRQLVIWCRAHMAHDVLVTFSFNSTLLGGITIRYGSHVFDWSFRRQILAAREHFPEILRHV